MTTIDDPRTLVGEWRLRRWIDDRAAGESHELEGLLEVREVADGHLGWRESLVWPRPEGLVEVGRELGVVRTQEGWWVRFSDGRDFHPWLPGEQVVHPCSPDTYAGLVTGDTARWMVTWEVSGPAKDYTMTSTMTSRPE